MLILKKLWEIKVSLPLQTICISRTVNTVQILQSRKQSRLQSKSSLLEMKELLTNFIRKKYTERIVFCCQYNNSLPKKILFLALREISLKAKLQHIIQDSSLTSFLAKMWLTLTEKFTAFSCFSATLVASYVFFMGWVRFLWGFLISTVRKIS